MGLHVESLEPRWAPAVTVPALDPLAGVSGASAAGLSFVPLAPDGKGFRGSEFPPVASGAPPRVTGVFVRGSAWTTSYLGLSPFTTIGPDHLGWQMRDGASQVAGSATVPWNNVNRVSVRFDQPISLPVASAATIVGKRLTGYTGSTPVQADVTVVPTGVVLLDSGRIAQFTLPQALATGRYVLSIASTGIVDATGTTPLDGEWTTGSSTFAAGSGDGTAGGIFNFAFNVLVGDVDANGSVNALDLTTIRSGALGGLGTIATAATFRHNLDGNDRISALDMTAWRQASIRPLGILLTTLASPPAPSASAATIGSPTFTDVTGTGVRLGATITGDGGEPVLERGVVLLAGATGAPEVTDLAATTLLSVGGLGAFTVEGIGLSPATAYRFRAFVRTSVGIVYSEVGSFTTAVETPPVIELLEMSPVLMLQPGIPAEACEAPAPAPSEFMAGGGVHAASGLAIQHVGSLTPVISDGVPSGPAHSWSSSAEPFGRQMFGNGRTSLLMPRLEVRSQDADGPKVVRFAFSPTDVRMFVRSPSVSTLFLPVAANSDSLTLEPGVFVYRTATGDTITFNDHSAGTAADGEFSSRTDRFGNRTSVLERGPSGLPTQVESSSAGAGASHAWAYNHVTVGGEERVATATLTRDGAVIRTLTYTYHDGSTAHGVEGDLESIEVRDGAGGLIDATYYRSYTSGQPDSDRGYPGALKFAFDAAARKRLAAAVPDFRTATDEAIAPFATSYYEYDFQRRVVRHDAAGAGCSACTGGVGTFTYGYTVRGGPPPGNFNTWSRKTTVTRPDGTEVVSYTGGFGQPMLTVTRVTESGQTRQWGAFTRYDDHGRPIWRASPEAVSLPTDLAEVEQYTDLMGAVAGNYVHLRDDAGLIEIISYGLATTATEAVPGNVLGLVGATAVQRGELGMSIPQTETAYVTRAAGGTTASFVARSTAFAPAAQTTTHAYTFRAGTTQVASVATTLPVVTAAHNGPGTADVQTRVFDHDGREVWSRDADGFLQYTAYDPVSGAVVKRIVDVDTARSSEFSAPPAGWTTPAGGGLHLVTATEVDALGRAVRITDPRGSVTYRVFDDVAHAVRTYVGWDATTLSPTGPTYLSRQDVGGTYLETLSFAAAPAIDDGGRPTGTEPVTNVQSLSRSLVNAAGQAVAADRYTSLDGVTYSTAAALGSEGINYLRTRTEYGKQGKAERIEAPSGTITHHVYDGLARLSSTWIGTDDSTTDGFKWTPANGGPASNMTRIAAHEYDHGGVGNGNRTRATRFPGGGATPRVVSTAYDWRNRPVVVKAGATDDAATEAGDLDRPLTYVEYDNLGRVTTRQVYDGDGVVVADADGDGTPDRPAAGLLRGWEASSYDARNRVFRTETSFVDQATGVVGPGRLATDLFYDRRGNLALEAAPGEAMMQYRYDGAGRTVGVLVLGDTNPGGWADAVSTAGALVLEQRDTTYDAAGNVILETTRQRFHDAAATALGLLGSPTTGIGARVSFSAHYFDGANRQTAIVDVGTNGGAGYVRPDTPPARSDTALVTSFTYDAAGRLQDTTDPRGVVSRTVTDMLGRTTASIANFTGGAPGAQSDVTTLFTFDAAGRLSSRTAVQPGGTPSQVTGYVYGVSPATGSVIASNDVLAETRYPDRITGLPSAADREAYGVDALGQRIAWTDRGGTVHGYVYDVVGRQTGDVVTVLGAGVDGAVRRIETAYDTLGRPVTVTSWSAVAGGAIVNQVASGYNGFGQLQRQWQAHGAAVDPAATPSVQTTYSEGVGGNHSRPTRLTYPDGTAVNFGYVGVDAAVSRPTSLSGSGVAPTPAVIEAFRYLGAATVIERSRPEVNVTLTMLSPTGAAGEAGDTYTGLDRFGRVVDQRWVAGSSPAGPVLDRTTFTYDRGGNRLTRGVPLAPAFDETYTFDALGQLQSYVRGSAGAPDLTQHWQFDALGNWTTLTTGGAGDLLLEPREHNAQNELQKVGSRELSYSATGNLTTDGEGRTMAFDAWNRLATVRDGAGRLLARYEYDGLNRRIVEQVATSTVSADSAPVRDMYYSERWQVLEERIRTLAGDIGATADTRYVWSPVYVDALVMRDRDVDGSASTGTGGLEERVYALQDANWNTTALVAASGVSGTAAGEVLGRFIYTPYGESLALTAAWTAATSEAVAALSWQHLFQGLESTEITGLAYVRNRDYSAALGRFIERDPIGFRAGDNNWYRFVGNSPIGFVDPYGYMRDMDECPDSHPHLKCWSWTAETTYSNMACGEWRKSALAPKSWERHKQGAFSERCTRDCLYDKCETITVRCGCFRTKSVGGGLGGYVLVFFDEDVRCTTELIVQYAWCEKRFNCDYKPGNESTPEFPTDPGHRYWERWYD